MWHMYTMEHYSALKKSGKMPCEASCMDLESITLSEVSQTERKKYLKASLICGI